MSLPGVGGRRTARRGASWIALAALCLAAAPGLVALNPGREPDGYSIQGWFTEHGLPSNKIRSVTQTRDGYLWLATAQGIARFDGSRFTSFTGATHPELRGGGFFAVLETPDGALWFGGDNGLFRWRSGRFERFTTAEGLAHNYVRALALTRDGAVVACTRAGYSIMRDGRLSTPGGIWRQVTGVARSYLERADGTILLGTDEGLWRITGETIEQLPSPGLVAPVPLASAGAGDERPAGGTGQRGTAFVGLIETSNGTAWIGFSGGLHCLRPDGTTESFRPPAGSANFRVVDVQLDRDGNLWVAASDGLHRLANGRLESASYPEQFGGTMIQKLFEDREGGLWVATSTGLFRLKDNVSTAIDVVDGLAQTSVYAVIEATDGAWWIGVWNGGLYRYDGRRATRVDAPGLDQILSLAETPDGAILIGAYSGLYRRTASGEITNLYQRENAATWQKELAQRGDTLLPGLAHSRVNSLAVDGDTFWAATDGALYHSSPGGFRAYTMADGLPGNVFKSVARARNGDIWTTVPPHGVARLHDGHWTVYACGKTISAIYPRAIYEDAAGTIWVTTEGGGLNRFKDGQWRTFTVRDGLADDFISGIVEDDRQNFWIACPRGIMRIPRQEFDERAAGVRTALQPRMFNRFDGLPRGETNQQGAPNAWRSRDGRLLFATDRGVAVIEPGEIAINRIAPPVYIERLAINGADGDLARPIVVPPGSNDIEIEYTAVSLLAPEKVRFKIRLAPLDRGWVDAGSRREIHYAKLPAGAYTFQVIASNNDGVWNTAGTTRAFTVRPYFYRTGWFGTLMAMVTAIAIVGTYRARVRTTRRKVDLLAGLVAERTRALQDEVTERRRSEEALRQAEAETTRHQARFKFIFEAVPVGISLVSADDLMMHLVNPAHERITGVPAGNSSEPGVFARASHPEDYSRQMERVQPFIRGEVEHYSVEKRYLHPDGRTVWAELTTRMLTDAVTGERQAITTLVDITERKQAEARLAESHRQLVAISRQAGMAEVATGVLHNVGNVLNSVNVSATLVIDQIRESKAGNLAKIGVMLQENAADLPRFLTEDPRGQRIPGYLVSVTGQIAAERATVVAELDHLRKSIEHIKDIVSMQQSYAKVSGVTESVAVAELVEDALRMNASALARHGLDVVRSFEPGLTMTVDRHKVLQILVNLIRNAKYACDDSGRTDKVVTLRVGRDGDRIRIAVHDNGVGIPPENLTRIFSHGFTTRKDGHGFGLHSGALVAKELGGLLTVQSAGPGHGATFILEIPLNLPSPAVRELTV